MTEETRSYTSLRISQLTHRLEVLADRKQTLARELALAEEDPPEILEDLEYRYLALLEEQDELEAELRDREGAND